MSEEVDYSDSEFSLAGNEKIDYKGILFKQIDYIRFLRTQDMGEFSILHLKLLPNKEELYLKWFTNSSVYQNAINSLKSLLISYNDDKFNNTIKTIERDYRAAYLVQKKNLVDKAKRTRMPVEKYDLSLVNLDRDFAFTNSTKKFERTFQECLLLMERAKFIGGNDLIKEKK